MDRDRPSLCVRRDRGRARRARDCRNAREERDVSHDAKAATTANAPSAQIATHSDSPSTPNDFVGVLLPPKMAGLSPRADGQIAAVRVKLGQAVKEGDVLVAFDPREKQHDLTMAIAELGMSRADAAGAGSDLVAARKRAARRNATVEVGGKKIALVSGEEAAQAHFEAQSAGARAASASARIAQKTARRRPSRGARFALRSSGKASSDHDRQCEHRHSRAHARITRIAETP